MEAVENRHVSRLDFNVIVNVICCHCFFVNEKNDEIGNYKIQRNESERLRVDLIPVES